MTREAVPGSFPFVDPKNLKRAAVICHRNADADAYLSAYALSSLLRDIAPNCEVDVVTPEGMTTLTLRLARKFLHKVIQDSVDDYDLYVAVDVGDAELLKDWRGKMEISKGVRVLVDHHPYRDAKLYDHVVVDEQATSAAEVVFKLFSEAEAKIDPMTAQALLDAIVFDSSHLAIANGKGLRTVVKLLDMGADVIEARRDLRIEPDYGEVMAKLKGAQRLKVYRVGDWTTSTSMIGSFQAHVARSLISLGADVAIVGGESEGETRVSMRSTQRFSDLTKVQLGTQVAEEVARSLGGHGGGHATAASFSTPATEDEAVKGCLKRLTELLGAEIREVA
ncbi:MAG: DHH family phosphoesterase [Nitrososphaerales archaeon]